MNTELIDSLRASSGAAFERGRALLSGDRLFDLRVEGRTLRGAARGVRQVWYAVELDLDEAGTHVVRGRCTCPAGADGRCKHVPALGLAWATAPGRFAVLSDLEARLRHRSYEELIAMVSLMVRAHPEVEALTVGPVPGGQREAPSVARWRTRADDVFRRHGADWTAVAGLVRELETLHALGGDFERQGERAHAAALFEGLVASIAANAARYPWPDALGRLRELAAACAERLPGNPPARLALASLDAITLPQPKRATRPRAAA